MSSTENKINFFSADYRDESVIIAGKRFPVGSFVVQMLNIYYDDDAALRISVFHDYRWKVQWSLERDYLYPENLERAAEELDMVWLTLPRIVPFHWLDADAEKERYHKLLSVENGRIITDYYRLRSKYGDISEAEAALDFCHLSYYDKDLFRKAQGLIHDIQDTLHFYESVADDLRTAFNELREFVSELDTIPSYDESHLLALAGEILSSRKLDILTEYVAVPKGKKMTTARRLQFGDYYSFLMTDFYEGLHRGHYPRRCPICKNYFPMDSARRQIYCNGYAPRELTGKRRMTCRNYGAKIKEREQAEGNPVMTLYNRRMQYLRVNKHRGNLSDTFAEAARAYLIEKKEEAILDEGYAQDGYLRDLEIGTMRSAVQKRLEERP